MAPAPTIDIKRSVSGVLLVLDPVWRHTVSHGSVGRRRDKKFGFVKRSNLGRHRNLSKTEIFNITGKGKGKLPSVPG